MSKCPYNSSSDPCEFEVQLMVANVAEEEAAETFHEMDAELAGCYGAFIFWRLYCKEMVSRHLN